MTRRGISLAVVFAVLIGAGGGYWLGKQPFHLASAAPEAVATWLGGWFQAFADVAGTDTLLPHTEPGNHGKPSDRTVKTERDKRQPLFYRNPMNPEITSPVPAKDAMGMDYVPGYADPAKPDRQPHFYRSPMNPEVTSPVPAKDAMGMDYVAVYADDGPATQPAGTVTIDPVTIQNIGVRTATAGIRTLSNEIRTFGRVDYDEERLSRLHPKIEGWVEKLYVSKTGQSVTPRKVLLSVYSPQLVSSQQEYLLALKNLRSLKESPYEDIRRGAEQLVEAARERLELLDMPAHQLRELEDTGKIIKSVHIDSPYGGIVLAVGTREGDYITPNTELYRIADLRRIWVYADVYEDELPWVKVGDDGEIRVASLPGRTFKGKVSYIYPYLDSKTRTIKVRLEFDNRDLALKPDMFANVTLFPERRANAVVIPSEAVLRSGTRNKVFVARAAGKFEPRDVTLGVDADGFVQIVDGVAAGEEVVTSAQFLIDSESKLREATTKMLKLRDAATPRGTTGSEPGHGTLGHAPPTALDETGAGNSAGR